MLKLKSSYPKDIGVIASVFIALIFILALINLYISIQFRNIYLEANRVKVISLSELSARYLEKEIAKDKLDYLFKNIASSFNLQHLVIADTSGNIVYNSWNIPGWQTSFEGLGNFRDFKRLKSGEIFQQGGEYIYYNPSPPFFLYLLGEPSGLAFDRLFSWHLFYITVSLLFMGFLGFLLIRNLFLPMHYTAQIAHELGVKMEKEDFVPATFSEVFKKIKIKEEELHQFAGYIAHEFRNSIGTVIGMARLVEKGKKRASDIIRECQTMEDLINNLIEYSRPLKPSFMAINVQEVIQEALQRIKLPKRIRLKKDLPAKLPRVRGDYDLILHAIMNLLKNGIDAIEKKGELEIRGEQRDDGVYIIISDTGEGIEGADLVKVFSPFFTKKEQGVGLGLAYVKKIMELHHGRVECESVRGKGSKFTLIFPT